MPNSWNLKKRRVLAVSRNSKKRIALAESRALKNGEMGHPVSPFPIEREGILWKTCVSTALVITMSVFYIVETIRYSSIRGVADRMWVLY